jgi:hypothetical protein
VDIHPPHAIHSWKDFGIQLVTITAGILIALSLEGVRETPLLKTGRADIHQVGLEVVFPTLNAASWQTAERTGALAHMDYAEVQKYAALYRFQELLFEQHRRALDIVSAAIGTLTLSEDADPTKSSPADLQRFREQIVSLRSGLLVEEQWARTASDRYKKALE